MAGLTLRCGVSEERSIDSCFNNSVLSCVELGAYGSLCRV